MKGIIYYTDNRLENSRYEKVMYLTRDYIKASGLPVVTCSLRPTGFGDREYVMEGLERSYPTMVKQIVTALEQSVADVVFFCEHDVLYHPSHFEFSPVADDVFFYNSNNWRWYYPKDRLIKYDELISLSGLCCSRELALRHYSTRLARIIELGYDINPTREPAWARKWGYEPGTKAKRKGGFSDETHLKWQSDFPNIDVRHKRTYSPVKMHKEDFKHQPTNWKETTMDGVRGWDLKMLFGL